MNSRLSASERRIAALEQRLAELEQMRVEYDAFLNYVVYCFGVYDADNETREFILWSDQMRRIPIQPIKSEIMVDEETGKKYLSITRIDPTTNGMEPKLIV